MSGDNLGENVNTSNSSSPTFLKIQARSADLFEGEQLCWRYEVTKGLFRKHLESQYFVTNYRCFTVSGESDTTDGQIIMGDFDDVVVMNSQRVSSSIGNGFYFGGYGSGRYTGSRSGISSTYGDICFMKNGTIVLIFNSVRDPYGVKRMVTSLNKAQIKTSKNSLTEKGLNDYCSKIRSRTRGCSNLQDNDLILKAVKVNDQVSFQFSLNSPYRESGIMRFRCLRKAIEQTLDEMPIITKSVFESLLVTINQKADSMFSNSN